VYLDALEFLDEERETWAPFEALADLSDEQLSIPVADAHGWSGRQLMAHLLAWQENATAVAMELAVDETSPTKVGPTATGRNEAARRSTPPWRRSGRPCRWPRSGGASAPSRVSCAAT